MVQCVNTDLTRHVMMIRHLLGVPAASACIVHTTTPWCSYFSLLYVWRRQQQADAFSQCQQESFAGSPALLLFASTRAGGALWAAASASQDYTWHPARLHLQAATHGRLHLEQRWQCCCSWRVLLWRAAALCRAGMRPHWPPLSAPPCALPTRQLHVTSASPTHVLLTVMSHTRSALHCFPGDGIPAWTLRGLGACDGMPLCPA